MTNKKSSITTSASSIDNIYSLDGKVPVGKSIPFGLQHVLAMFVANIAPIMIVAGACGLTAQNTAALIQTAMIVAGIGTLVQLFSVWRLGARLPIVMGSVLPLFQFSVMLVRAGGMKPLSVRYWWAAVLKGFWGCLQNTGAVL